MALVSPIGYSGPVTNEEFAALAGYMGSPYAVLPLASDPYGDPSAALRPSIVTGPARTVRIAGPGRAFGAGVIDTNDANVDIPIPDPGGTGWRWYLIALRRTWGATKASSFVTIASGNIENTPTIPSTRKKGPGVQDDQPIALALVKGGDPKVYNLIDLRLFYGPGGLQAISPVVQQYLPVGTVFRCGDTVYSHTLAAGSLTPTWIARQDPQQGQPPYLMVGRRTAYSGPVTGGSVPFYAGRNEDRQTGGDWSSTFEYSNGATGASNPVKDTPGAYIRVKKSGVYAYGCRIDLHIESSVSAHTAISADIGSDAYPGLGDSGPHDPYWHQYVLNGERVEWTLTNTLWLPAGAKLAPSWGRQAGSALVNRWFMWMTRIANG